MPDVDRIPGLDAVLDRTGLTRATLYRKIANGSFPPHVGLNPCCAGWRESSIRRWITNTSGYRADNDNDDPHAQVRHGEG